eukprot:10392159-Prorocentrum_lima.AAC.1
MTSSLVGSEMCIRDRAIPGQDLVEVSADASCAPGGERSRTGVVVKVPVSYTHLTLPTICSV